MTTTWKQALREGAVSGSVASVLSAAALVLEARREAGAPAAGLNAISHWIWDTPALHEDCASARHTMSGYLIHHAASIWWGTWHARLWGARPAAKRPVPALLGAAAASAIACAVDYRMTPERLTPGFEHRLSSRALFAVYAAFALGLALGSLAVPAAQLAAREGGDAERLRRW